MNTMTHRPIIHYDDVDQLNQLLCDATWSEWGAERMITKEDIIRFADVTHNHQWIHEDEKRCINESPYHGMIAHGLLIASLIPSLLPEERYTVFGHKMRIIRGIDKLRLPSPVYPNDRIHARTQTLRAYAPSSARGTVIERNVEVWSMDGNRPVVACLLLFQYL